MRKLFLIVFIFSVGIFVYAQNESYVLFLGEAYRWNDVWEEMTETEVSIVYIPDLEAFFLVQANANWLGSGLIGLDKSRMDTFRAILDKYLEWEKTAVENEVTIEKEIPIGPINTAAGWSFGDEVYSSQGFDPNLFGDDLSLRATFFSQSKTRHHLVLESNKVVSTENQFITYKMEQLYLTKAHVIALQKGISQEAINRSLIEYQEQKETGNLFN